MVPEGTLWTPPLELLIYHQLTNWYTEERLRVETLGFQVVASCASTHQINHFLFVMKGFIGSKWFWKWILLYLLIISLLEIRKRPKAAGNSLRAGPTDQLLPATPVNNCIILVYFFFLSKNQFHAKFEQYFKENYLFVAPHVQTKWHVT